MIDFLKRNVEWFLLGLVLLALFLKYQQLPAADSMFLLMAASLGFFYLASGLIVLLDRARIERVMRILYLVGMWSIAVCLVGIVGRFLNWDANRELLIAGISSGVAVLLFALLNRGGQEGEVLRAFDREISPLVKRVLPFVLFSAGILLTKEIDLYRTFGQFREDARYVQLLDARLADRKNDAAHESWLNYHRQKLEAIDLEKRRKYGLEDSDVPPEN